MKTFKTMVLIFLFVQKTQAQQQYSIYFDSNKFELNNSEKKNLLSWINSQKKSKIIGAYGFCDEDGSIIYNDTLAFKRIQSVFEIIKKNNIAFRNDFKQKPFGKLHQQEKIKAKNRKVTLFYLQENELHLEEKIIEANHPKVSPILNDVEKKQIIFPDAIEVENPNGTKTVYELNRATMQQINQAQKGDKILLENLNFVINTYAIVPESRSKLYELLLVMQQNSKIKIEIQGHLCCVAVDVKDLSTQRAKAIYKFLEYNGIQKNRMSYKGFGSDVPLFLLPEKTEQERAANRRVELVILENE